jgi:hypothetical protein
MARTMAHKVTIGQLDHMAALLRLVKLCLELCGTYAHDPFNPWFGTVTYNTPQILSTQKLNDFISKQSGQGGVVLAREAAALAYDLSGSPQESFMGPALFFPNRTGGLALCEFEANKALDLSDYERSLIEWRTITPDFTLWPYRSVVEYLGHIHEEKDNPRIDHVRTLDYQTLGLREFAFWYEDVATLQSFTQSSLRIVSAIEQFEGPAYRTRINKINADPKFKRAQQNLFAVFRPWLR